jgi:hypothetical protein
MAQEYLPSTDTLSEAGINTPQRSHLCIDSTPARRSVSGWRGEFKSGGRRLVRLKKNSNQMIAPIKSAKTILPIVQAPANNYAADIRSRPAHFKRCYFSAKARSIAK